MHKQRAMIGFRLPQIRKSVLFESIDPSKNDERVSKQLLQKCATKASLRYLKSERMESLIHFFLLHFTTLIGY